MASARVTLRVCLLALILVVDYSLTHAQSLKVGLHASAFRLLAEESGHSLQGIFTRPVSEGGYGFGPWAPSVDLEVRYSPYRGVISVAGDVSYTPLKGTGRTGWYDELGVVPGERGYSAKLYIASLGAQFRMLQGSIRPYLGARLQWSFMSQLRLTYLGTENQQMLPVPEDGFVCFGVALLGGVECDLNSSWSLDVTGRYNFTSVGNRSQREYGDALSIGIGVFYEIL